jgi:hypothetical protein
MRPHPTTTYRRAAPAVWALIRADYLAGLSGPTVAARFGVSVWALRKRARREGWTKARQAEIVAAVMGAAPLTPPGPAALPAPLAEAEAAVAALDPPMEIRPADLARKALARAAEAVRRGEGLSALRLVRAGEAIARLDGQIAPAFDDVDRLEADHAARRDQTRLHVRSLALSLARLLLAGEPLPEPYADLEADWADGRDSPDPSPPSPTPPLPSPLVGGGTIASRSDDGWLAERDG